MSSASLQKKPKHKSLGILFLDDVYKKDCFLEPDFICSNTKGTNVDVYDRLPNNYTTVDLWLKNTNLSCWWCTRFFTCRPWFIPNSVERITTAQVSQTCNAGSSNDSTVNASKVYLFSTEGIFCSANCVRAYIELHVKDYSDHQNKISLLHFLYEIQTGKKTACISPSPPPTIMVRYGGVYTPVEYQKKIDKLNIDPSVYLKFEANMLKNTSDF